LKIFKFREDLELGFASFVAAQNRRLMETKQRVLIISRRENQHLQVLLDASEGS
jgi:hypothetical protein